MGAYKVRVVWDCASDAAICSRYIVITNTLKVPLIGGDIAFDFSFQPSPIPTHAPALLLCPPGTLEAHIDLVEEHDAFYLLNEDGTLASPSSKGTQVQSLDVLQPGVNWYDISPSLKTVVLYSVLPDLQPGQSTVFTIQLGLTQTDSTGNATLPDPAPAFFFRQGSFPRGTGDRSGDSFGRCVDLWVDSCY